MKAKLERYKTIDAAGKALGISKADLALMRAKKRAIAKLIRARENHGLTQAEVAKLVSTKQPAISRMEAGLVSEVSFDFLFKVAWVLGVTLTLKPSSSPRAA